MKLECMKALRSANWSELTRMNMIQLRRLKYVTELVKAARPPEFAGRVS